MSWCNIYSAFLISNSFGWLDSSCSRVKLGCKQCKGIIIVLGITSFSSFYGPCKQQHCQDYYFICLLTFLTIQSKGHWKSKTYIKILLPKVIPCFLFFSYYIFTPQRGALLKLLSCDLVIINLNRKNRLL